MDCMGCKGLLQHMDCMGYKGCTDLLLHMGYMDCKGCMDLKPLQRMGYMGSHHHLSYNHPLQVEPQ